MANAPIQVISSLGPVLGNPSQVDLYTDHSINFLQFACCLIKKWKSLTYFPNTVFKEPKFSTFVNQKEC